jgi:hypothetical protein
MTKKGTANGYFFGNFLYEQILSQRPHFLMDLPQLVDFRFVQEHCKDFSMIYDGKYSLYFRLYLSHIS